MADQHTTWKEVLALHAEKKLPEHLLPFYTFAAEGEELTDEQMLANVAKYTEHVAIGALTVDNVQLGIKPAAPKVPPAKGKEGVSREAWADKNPAEKIAHGHKHGEPGASADMSDVLGGE